MRAFVTGGTGFLGANLIERLIECGWQVTALHRPESDTRLAHSFGAELVEGSLTDINSLQRAVTENIDAVFHLAANTSMWRGGQAQQWRDNVEGSATLARVARQKNAGRMIVTSSISAYGYQKNPIDEQSPQLADDPRHGYLYTKKRAEIAVRKEIEQGLDAVFLNPCAIVGKYDVTGWAQTFLLMAGNRLPGVPPGSGSFCHVAEVAQAHIDAFARGRCGDNYILAGIDASFLEFFATIARLLNKPEPKRTTPAAAIYGLGWLSDLVSRFTGREPAITPEKATLVNRCLIARCDKARRELGYSGDVPLETMLRESRDWLLTRGLLPSDENQTVKETSH
ncbi:SDR family oxidoreductase [Microbulbifer discodermiae]|uniref:SDR family oxidoreductase n=1 Tax=Microbulbifer sp. 2201CG32-9 TaxID=3232309 RepID=UPI00345B576C